MRNGRRFTSEPAVAPAAAPLRCAIYTRKSTDEGLSQDFNSLDAQREAAEAYINSQRHEGWTALPDRYDDGGFTGGNMDRPALQRLFADVEAGRVDCVVVYKVDRLSRSLLDFARIMELFDKHGVSFVSVTQQFNTTASLGRLTLNILLSFAQFEREIIAERTRDKMSAARKKGKWMGGIPVLGYDVDPRGGRLLVNPREAERVRAIFDLYLQHRSVIGVVHELNLRGWPTKGWRTKNGRDRQGKPFTKNALFRLLANVIYTGNVNHKGAIFPGEHEPILDGDTWERVNKLLRGNGTSGGRDLRNKYGALLRGMLYCETCGTAMLHTYTVKGGRCYRYYVCLTAQQRGWDACSTKSVNAHDIEQAVVDRIRGLGMNREVAAEVHRKVIEQAEAQAAAVLGELRSQERELQRLNREMARLAAAPASALRTDRMADLQEQVAGVESRLTELRTKRSDLDRQVARQSEVLQALEEWDPVWTSLNSQEQIRVLRILIDRIAYDGATGRVAVSFRSPGLKALCEPREDS